MKKEIYFCDSCNKQMNSEGNHCILMISLEKYPQDLCDTYAEIKKQLFYRNETNIKSNN